MGLLKRTLRVSAILAACTAASKAQEAEPVTPLPPVTVTATEKAKPKKSSSKKAVTKAVVAQPGPAAAAASTALPQLPAGTASTDSGNAVGASAKSGLAARAAAPNATVVMEGAQLQQYNQLSIGDVVRRLPGVTFPGVNRSRDIKLRGIPKEYTQVLLDGRPLLDGDTSRNIEVDRIPASFIERIEITRTPLASMDSMGAAGTVNIITRRSFGASGGQLTMGAGRMEDNGSPGEISGWQGGETGPLRYFIGGGYQRRLVQESANEFTFKGDGSPDGGELGPQHRKFDEYTLLSRFELAVDPANTVVVAPSYLRTTERRDQNALRLSEDQTYVDRDTHEMRERIRETYGANVEWQHDFGYATASRVFFDYQRGREDTTRDTYRTSYNADGSVKGTPNVRQAWRFVPVDLERIAAGTVVSTRVGAHALEAGFGWAQRSHDENAITVDVTSGAVSTVDERTYKVTETIYHAYVSDSFKVFGSDLLTLGLRLEQSATETLDNTRTNYDTDSTDFNPSINYRLSAAQNLDFRVGVARTLRRPNLGDLTPTITDGSGTLSDPYERGDPNTTPEKIWGLDVGTDYYLFNGTGILAANFFARSLQDKIETTLAEDAGDWVRTFRNAGDGKLYGVELEGRIPLAFMGVPDLTLWGNATAMKSELTDALTGQKRRFDEQPDFVTNIGFDYYVAMWDTTFGLGYNRTYAYDQDILLEDGTSQYSEFSALDRLDASVRIALAEKAVLTLSASNLLRAKDERTLITRDASGDIDSRTVSIEPSPIVYYARLSQGW
ncbi:iron complex outermembrane recepter protein [Hyphomicrobium sp. 1Nfss2.1]|uniref:TonB-dependent receptor plug domain-containing protein n=1 Tax=Hyphomicrobium sp. 1Nfss2.1 TaxID=3413936 RepID=UPI003C7BDE1C